MLLQQSGLDRLVDLDDLPSPRQFVDHPLTRRLSRRPQFEVLGTVVMPDAVDVVGAVNPCFPAI